jgi:hypothetical protein
VRELVKARNLRLTTVPDLVPMLRMCGAITSRQPIYIYIYITIFIYIYIYNYIYLYIYTFCAHGQLSTPNLPTTLHAISLEVFCRLFEYECQLSVLTVTRVTNQSVTGVLVLLGFNW